MNKKLFALLCISFLGNIHAMQENCQQNYITNKTFPIKNIETIKFSKSGDITFSGNAVLADFHNLKTLGFNHKDVKIVTANGIRYPETLNPHEDLGAPENCLVELNSNIKQQVNDTYKVIEINPDNLTSIAINKSAPNNIQHVQDTAPQIIKRDQKVAESINYIIQKITTTLDEGMNDDLALSSSIEDVENTTDAKIRYGVLYSNGIGCSHRNISIKLDTCCYNAFHQFWRNFDSLERHYAKNFTVLEDTDIVKQKFDALCLAINHCKVLVNSIIIGGYRISFSRAFPDRLGAIDNMLPIGNEQRRVRIFYFHPDKTVVSAMTASQFAKIQTENNIQVKVTFPIY